MTKVPNYTEAQAAELVEAYVAVETEVEREEVIKEFAETFGKKVGSIRAKLTREGVYVAKTKAAAKPRTVRKAELVTQLANLLKVEEDKLDTLDKATRATLEQVVGRTRAMLTEV
jgi:hypothetical protein